MHLHLFAAFSNKGYVFLHSTCDDKIIITFKQTLCSAYNRIKDRPIFVARRKVTEHFICNENNVNSLYTTYEVMYKPGNVVIF